MPVMRVDDDVWRELQLRVNQDDVFKDNPNRVLRRILRIDTADTQGTGNTLFDLMANYITASSGRQKAKVMAEIKRRFITFGWVQPGPTK